MSGMPELLTLAEGLRALVGDRASVASAVRDHHSRGESYHTPAAPDIVVYPLTTEEVSAVVRLAAEHATPIVPFGAGTSLEGQVLALHGGVSIDLSRMNRSCGSAWTISTRPFRPV